MRASKRRIAPEHSANIETRVAQKVTQQKGRRDRPPPLPFHERRLAISLFAGTLNSVAAF
jgi:hypothetical protein